MKIMKIKKFDSLLVEWQKELRLQDWDVKAYLKRHYNVSSGATGTCDFNFAGKTAVIRVLHSSDADPAFSVAHDPEQTLVHELLHLHFAQFFSMTATKENDPDYYAKEQAIDLIAHALVNAKRKKR